MTTAMNEAEKLAAALDSRVVRNWVHSTGTSPKATGFRHDAECQQAAALLRRQAEQIKVLREALEEAASSLTYIANTACKRDEELMSDAINVRGYARSRASVAEAALGITKDTK